MVKTGNIHLMDELMLLKTVNREDVCMEEVDIFKAVLAWGKKKVKEGSGSLNSLLKDIIALIRFPVMTLKEFTSTVVPTGLLTQKTLLSFFTYFGSEDQMRATCAKKFAFKTVPRLGSKSLYRSIIVWNRVRPYPIFRISTKPIWIASSFKLANSTKGSLAMTAVYVQWPCNYRYDGYCSLSNNHKCTLEIKECFPVNLPGNYSATYVYECEQSKIQIGDVKCDPGNATVIPIVPAVSFSIGKVYIALEANVENLRCCYDDVKEILATLITRFAGDTTEMTEVKRNYPLPLIRGISSGQT